MVKEYGSQKANERLANLDRQKSLLVRDVEQYFREVLVMRKGFVDAEVNYKNLIKDLTEAGKYEVKDYLPDCKYIESREEGYFVKKNYRERAILDFWTYYAGEMFKSKRKLNKNREVLANLYTDFIFLIDRKFDLKEYNDLLSKTKDANQELYFFQKQVVSLLGRIFANEIKPEEEITDLVELAMPFQNTIIGKYLQKCYSSSAGKYYLKITDCNCREFRMLFYMGVPFWIEGNFADFFCKVVDYYWESVV